MKKPRLNAESHALLQQVIEQYQPKSMNDIRYGQCKIDCVNSEKVV